MRLRPAFTQGVADDLVRHEPVRNVQDPRLPSVWTLVPARAKFRRTMTDGAGSLARALLAGDRRALARAITLVESGREDHRARAEELLDAVTESGRQSLRIGLSGAPGAGKSTFIEAFGCMLTEQGMRVAVLAVDPSSVRSGGSILGDKTRMERLSREPGAFIRPSPSQSHLGGIARRTKDAVALCEAAGFDVVLIETVGVGQSETAAADMSDVFALLIAPGGGDELQGVKRGIMEIADLILVNKADGDLKPAAGRTVADYSGALRLLGRRKGDPEDFPKAMPVSAHEGTGLREAWEEISALAEFRKAGEFWDERRSEQACRWFEDDVRRGLLRHFDVDRNSEVAMQALRSAVAEGTRSPGAAAREALARLRRTAGS